MNLPRIHPRVMIVEKAELQFGTDLNQECFIEELEITMEEGIKILALCISNLDEENKVILNPIHEKVEKLLDKISKQHELTYGEKVKILSNQILSETKYVIRWERHRNFEKKENLK